ncbi:MAG: hypothetical protein LBR85_00980 [Oscillospiraceae bacterium]|jgi:hypothetical protein|nr:hypothetical protein [Oscillospiraceae bacterium]
MNTKKLTFSAVMAGLAVAFMWMTAVIPPLDLSFCGAAAICVALAAARGGTAWGAMSYAVTAVLAALFLPNKAMVMFFAAMFGPYPLIRRLCLGIPSKATRWIVKLAFVNVSAIGAFLLFRWAFTEIDGALWQQALLLLLYNAAMIVYDFVLVRLEDIAKKRFKL